MKTWARFLLLGAIVWSGAFPAPAQNHSPQTFQAPQEAVAFYRDQLANTPLRSLNDVYNVLGITLDSESADFLSLKEQFQLFLKRSGKVRDVEAIRTVEAGNYFRRTCYLVNYEHNVVCVEVWFVNSLKGWMVLNLNVFLDTDPTQTLRKIPEVFLK